ncbi:MAG: ankyrin repeat domain-containing protein [Pseudomonadota bacterium]
MDRIQALINYVKLGQLAELKNALTQHPGDMHTQHSSGKSLLLLAAYYKQDAVAKELCSRGIEPDIYEATALGDFGAVEKHIATRPSSIFTRHSDGTSLLGLATYFGHPRIVQLLLEYKADPNQSSTSRATVLPLHSAIAYKDPDCSYHLVKALLSGGANPNLVQRKNRTALHLAVLKNRPKLAELLLERGADIWVKDSDGQTAEEFAQTAQHQELCRIFAKNRVAIETEAFIDTQLLAAMETGELPKC